MLDDNPLVREVVRRMLDCRGYSVVVAADANDALDLLARQRIDAAIVDVDMPVMNGVEACRALRNQAAAAGRSLLVWLMTGVTRPDLAARALAAGALGVIAKPFTTDELVACVETGLAA